MKRFFIFLLTVFITLPAVADEGMWLLPLLKQQKYVDMQKLGLQLEAEDIYNPEGPSIKDAIVHFGGGCTGEVVSPDGLILTNHHCGYGQIQQHSTVENDYLTHGFWATSRREELPNPGLTVTFIDAIEDVTAYVKAALEKDTDPLSMNFMSPRFLNQLAREKVGEAFLNNNTGTSVEIRPFYGGNQYYMFTKKTYSDVRLVGAPPSSIGKFGADTDNWMWPRHTGDFSVFRVYADANGNPATYAENNVPLRVKKWLQISLKGVQENDYAMMIGFPGTTKKYYTSWEVAERRDIDNAVRIAMREMRQQVLLEEMLADPAVRIQYSSKYAGSTNAYKNAIGTNWAIAKRDFEQVKKAEQERLLAWSQQHNKTEYPEALKVIEQLVADRKDLRFRSWMLDEAIQRSIECTRVPVNTERLIEAIKNKDKEVQKRELTILKESYERFADNNYAPEVDKKVAKVMLREYCARINKENRPAAFAEIDKRFKGDIDSYVENLFKQSIYGSRANFDRFLAKPTVKALQEDPLILFAQSILDERRQLNESLAAFDAAYLFAHRSYVKGLLEMDQDKMDFPDANSTLRLTYGQVKGYAPSDAVYYNHQTTLEGVMEKEDPDNWEFVVADRLKELYRTKDYGRYQTAEGNMPVAFCATTHSTGGNSGSPVLDANGALIGINFDRNWEGVGGDIQYLPDYQRSIIVDIRYVLFVIDKYAGASYLLDEMDLVEKIQ
ncbi:S46 family peptidase [Parabacteroides sp. OttesenSCG-928-K15]|nr:S46 family peptidase [Parabacteroides sp. OttesenSCG-928-K15]